MVERESCREEEEEEEEGLFGWGGEDGSETEIVLVVFNVQVLWNCYVLSPLSISLASTSSALFFCVGARGFCFFSLFRRTLMRK